MRIRKVLITLKTQEKIFKKHNISRKEIEAVCQEPVVLEHAQDFSSMQRQKQAELVTSHRLDEKSRHF